MYCTQTNFITQNPRWSLSPWARSRTVFLAFLAISFLSFATVQKNHGCFTRFLQLSTSLWQIIEVKKDNFSVLFGYGSRLENTTAKLSQFNFLARKKKTAQGLLACKLTADWQGTHIHGLKLSKTWLVSEWKKSDFRDQKLRFTESRDVLSRPWWVVQDLKDIRRAWIQTLTNFSMDSRAKRLWKHHTSAWLTMATTTASVKTILRRTGSVRRNGSKREKKQNRLDLLGWDSAFYPADPKLRLITISVDWSMVFIE